jgi:hypothetical protein
MIDDEHHAFFVDGIARGHDQRERDAKHVRGANSHLHPTEK